VEQLHRLEWKIGRVRVAIIADTHMPRSGRRLPLACVEQLQTADLVVHAGDLIALSVLEMLRGLGPRVVAVAGNVDEPAVRAHLPERAVVEVEGARIGVIHDAGPAHGRLERLRAWFPAAQAVVFGHTHMPAHERDRDGFQIFNPGSPTERRRAPARAMGIARIEQGEIEFELISLE
jgi:putative phosphoesterase